MDTVKTVKSSYNFTPLDGLVKYVSEKIHARAANNVKSSFPNARTMKVLVPKRKTAQIHAQNRHVVLTASNAWVCDEGGSSTGMIERSRRWFSQRRFIPTSGLSNLEYSSGFFLESKICCLILSQARVKKGRPFHAVLARPSQHIKGPAQALVLSRVSRLHESVLKRLGKARLVSSVLCTENYADDSRLSCLGSSSERLTRSKGTQIAEYVRRHSLFPLFPKENTGPTSLWLLPILAYHTLKCNDTWIWDLY